MSTARPPTASLPATTRMGAVHLTVADLDRSLAFYGESLGLAVIEREDGRAVLGTGGTGLLGLAERPGARPVRNATGLYHFALLVPERVDLARWLVHAGRSGVPLVGMSDHFVSEAIYLADPDGHGIEIYHDRPREVWEGLVAARMTTDPLDVPDLLSELDDPATVDFDALPAGTEIGHVHLQVADLGSSIAFYRDVLGFDLMGELFGSAAFLSAGGYHHHVGANTWHSLGAAPPPEGAAGLRHATIVLPDQHERDLAAARVADAGQETEAREDGVVVTDPSRIRLLLVAPA